MKNNEIPLLPNTFYHIYNHANGKENLFANPDNFSYFLKRYEYFIQPIANTFAYCLMPNHLHLMVKIKTENELQHANSEFQLAKGISIENIKAIPTENLAVFISKTFGNLFSSYTQAFNKQQNRKGSLFIPNFKRKPIENITYYAKLIFYIHNNPVHHGFVNNMEDWIYSSYNSYLTDKKTKIAKEEALDWFGNKEEFIRFHSKEKIDTSFEKL